jgi:hypothetical protein
LITTQEGGITYNITIPQDDEEEKDSVRISMPNLDDAETKEVVSMPSLHDEEENTQSSQEQTEVPMDLEELQGAAGEGQQLKFIVDENGQFLQLDNHILTTDADGNQILVQGTDQEQLQHLLQSVGVDGNQVLVQLQGNGEGMDGEGATLQMLADGNQGQMILVQGADGEQQLIDASMLQTEDGNLILQQGEDGQTHLTTADGIPVSVSFSGEGGEGQITMTMASGHEEGEQIFMEEGQEHGQVAGEEQEQFTAIEGQVEAEQPVEAAAEGVTSTTEEAKEVAAVSEAAVDEKPAEEEKPVEETPMEVEAETKTDEPKVEEEKVS